MAMNMSPEMVKLAQERMASMSPEHMAQMAQMAQNMNPTMMREAQEQMSKLTPEQLRQGMEQMKSMSPDALKQQYAAAQAQMGGRSTYLINGATALKNEGNALVAEKKWAEAIAKYERAKTNIAGDSSADAVALGKSCTLNLGLCYLKSGQYQKCIETCNETLIGDGGRNFKALSRRGHARKQLGNLVQAKSDLTKALALAPPSDGTCAQWLQEVEDALAQAKARGEITEADEQNLPTEAEDLPRPQRSASASTSAAVGANMNLGGMGAMKPEQARMAASMMKDLSPEQLEQMARVAPGGMNIDPDLLKQSAQMMQNMSEEDLSNMMDMAAKMQAAGISPMGGLGANAMAPGPDGKVTMSEDMMKKASDMMANPEMMQSVSKMMASMSPDALHQMSSQAGYSLSKEQAEKTVEMMKSMKPETMARMMKAATFMQRAYLKAKSAYNWANQYKMVVFALLILLLAWWFNSTFLSAATPVAGGAVKAAVKAATAGAEVDIDPDDTLIDPGEPNPSFGGS